jgi:hypothetical protein
MTMNNIYNKTIPIWTKKLQPKVPVDANALKGHINLAQGQRSATLGPVSTTFLSPEGGP